MDITLNLPGSVLDVLREKKEIYGSEEKYLTHLILQNLNQELKRHESELKGFEKRYGSYSEFEKAVKTGKLSSENMGKAGKWHKEWKDLMKWKTTKEARDDIEHEILRMN